MTVLDTAFIERFAEEIGPIGKSLGMLIRPTFVASEGKTLVWGDWSAIEARVLPWLAASPGAEKVLDIFRRNDADPKLPDIYKITAGELLGTDPLAVSKDQRQSHGKVPTLSLGFGGGVGALQKMAVNYHVFFDEPAAKALVESWRGRNPWAPEFWGHFYTDRRTGEVVRADGLWGAVHMALRNPGTAYPAGRVAYIFDPGYMDGTLFCALPCGRLLTYPDCKVRTRKLKDKDTGEEIEKTAVWYRKGYGWSALWHGKCAENITQAVAGSILRETLVVLEKTHGMQLGLFETVGHTHDEIVLEAEDNEVSITAARTALERLMADEHERPKWRDTLPLAAEVVDNWYYTKAIG